MDELNWSEGPYQDPFSFNDKLPKDKPWDISISIPIGAGGGKIFLHRADRVSGMGYIEVPVIWEGDGRWRSNEGVELDESDDAKRASECLNEKWSWLKTVES